MKATVSVVIPSYRPGELFSRQQRMLQRQNYPIEKIVIVNTDRSLFQDNLLPDNQNIHVTHIEKKDFDHAGTRNLGVSFTDSDYVLLMTDDAIPKDEMMISEMVLALDENPLAGAVYGRQLPTEDSSEDEKISRSFNYPDESFVKSIGDLKILKIKTYFQSNVCCMYRRSVFEELGGFETPAIFNEDMVFCCAMLKAGYESVYCSKAQVYHAHHYSGLQQLKRNFDLGVSQALHPEVFSDTASEGEGLRMVRSAFKKLREEKKQLLIPQYVWITGCKYIGYTLGKHFRLIPKQLIKVLTMNPVFWNDKALSEREKGEKL